MYAWSGRTQLLKCVDLFKFSLPNRPSLNSFIEVVYLPLDGDTSDSLIVKFVRAVAS
jgi:hypothetical protein